MGKSRQITISPSITLWDSPFSTLDHNVKVISGQKSSNHSGPVRQLSVFSSLDQLNNGRQWTSPLLHTAGHHYKPNQVAVKHIHKFAMLPFIILFKFSPSAWF